MAGSFYGSENDSMDIGELASLNGDISDDFIEKLQNQLTNSLSTGKDTVNINDDSTLFEEIQQEQKSDTQEIQDDSTFQQTDINSIPDAQPIPEEVSEPKQPEKKEEISINQNFDDNFIKKYKAKLNKKQNGEAGQNDIPIQERVQDNLPEPPINEPIENISQGNITEKPLTKDMKTYNESLDFLDGNVKYSKYVIYIDPQNVDFIDGLTVKERKNLINGILRQQDDIAITKQRFKVMQTIIRQVVIAILTVSISIPLVYHAINASLEATIDNHRRSQTNWQTLYKEHGKVTPN